MRIPPACLLVCLIVTDSRGPQAYLDIVHYHPLGKCSTSLNTWKSLIFHSFRLPSAAQRWHRDRKSTLRTRGFAYCVLCRICYYNTVEYLQFSRPGQHLVSHGAAKKGLGGFDDKDSDNNSSRSISILSSESPTWRPIYKVR